LARNDCSDGKTHNLADCRGKQAVVLAWFPKAFTPGCTSECKAFAAFFHLGQTQLQTLVLTLRRLAFLLPPIPASLEESD
jgi:peroxiredoxin